MLGYTARWLSIAMSYFFSGHKSLNRLLSTLSAAESEALAPHLEVVSLSVGQVLSEPNQAIDYAYFPLNAVISLRNMMEAGQMVESTTVGNEGMIGIPLVLGTQRIPMEAVTQIPGEALRLSAKTFSVQVPLGSSFHSLLLRYTQSLMSQIAQDLACAMLHPPQERCCYLLAMMGDRVGSPDLPLTLEILSRLTGIRRTHLSTILATLERTGVLYRTHSQITILDRAALEASTCNCYQIIRSEFEQLLQ